MEVRANPSRSLSPVRSPRRSPEPPAIQDQGVFYDSAVDGAQRNAYYGRTLEENRGPQLFQALHALLTDTHQLSPDYKATTRMAPYLNEHADATLHCIYSGELYQMPEPGRPEYIDQLAVADPAWLSRWSQVQALASFHPEAVAAGLVIEGPLPRPVPHTAKGKPERDRGTWEPYGLEHAVPQSWFGRKRPMRTDFHILYPADRDANTARGNLPLRDVGRGPGVTEVAGGWTDGASFEPKAGKGELARATLYFMVRYPGEIGDFVFSQKDRREYTSSDLSQLLEWNRRYPPTTDEKRRNQAIAQFQGNRNPFVDFPDLANQVDFREGMGTPR